MPLDDGWEACVFAILAVLICLALLWLCYDVATMIPGYPWTITDIVHGAR